MAFSVGMTPGSVSTVGGPGTTQKIFQSNITNAAGVVQSPFVSGVTAYLLPIPGLNKLNGHRLNVILSGNAYVHGSSPTLQLQLLGSILASSWTVLAQTSAVSLTTANNYDWSLNATLICSNTPSVSTVPGGAGIVTGSFGSLINGTVGAGATLTNNLTGVNMNPTTGSPATASGAAAYYLAAALLFGVSDAANLASVTEFYAFTDQ
jgi:hypothetical protein